MYIYDGSKYTEEEIQNAADKAGLSFEEYTSKNNITFEEEVDFTTSTVEDANAVQQPMTASQAGYVEPEDTELASEDTSLDSPDPDPTKILPPGVESIKTDEENYNERLARLNDINDKKNKLKDQLIEFARLEIPDEKQASDYVKKNLEDFDKQNQTEKELIFSNKEFKLQQDALEQLRKDTGSNKAAGRGFGGGSDVVDYFKYIGRAFGIIDLRTEEASEVIKINKDVENAIATSLPKKDLQKLAMGVYTLQEKENLINEYKLPIIQKKTKDLSGEMLDLKAQAENSFGKINNRQVEINKELSIIKNRRPNKNYTQEEVNEYNRLSAEFKQLEDSKPALSKKFEDNFKAINIRKEILEGDYNVNLSKNVIYNNFELTNKVEKYREQFSGDGFWNATSDIILGDALGGLYSTIKKGTIGGATFLATAYFDAFTDSESYNRIDGFRDLITNFTDYSLLPSSEDEKFSITKEEGGLKDDVSARSLLKLGAQMVPFTGYLMMEAKKGNMSGIKQGVGRYLQGLKGSAKILTPLGKSLKNEVILADAAFRATILDNAKEAKNKGLDGVAADTYATTISLTEGVVQSIMPDVNFLKGTQGKAIKDAFIGNLKNVANKKSASTAAKEFFTNIGKEFFEEEFTYGLNLMTDASFGLALPKGSEFLNAQIELAAGTIMLSGGMGSVGAVKTFSNQKKLIYNQISKNIISTDAYLQKMQETVTDPDTKLEIEKARKFAKSIHSAVEKSPENVTADQIDLLVEKSKLIEEKNKTDSAFHPAIDEKIKNINEKISNSAIEKSTEQNFEKDIKLLEKSMQSAGLKSDETIVFEGETVEESQAKQKDYLINVVGKTEKFAEENKDSNGMFVTTKDGKEVFIVNKNTALGSGIVTTGQHEFLHKVLKSALQSNPELIEKAAKSLTEEVSKMVGGNEALLGTDWFKRWNSYTALVESGDYTENDFYEEALPLFSEALSNKELNYDPGFLTKIKDIFRQLFQNVGLKGLDFESGEGVKNFIIDYNKAYSKGKFKGTVKSFGKTGSVESARKAKKLDIKVDSKIKTNDKLSKQSIPEYTVTKEDWGKSKFPFDKLKNSEFKVKIAGQGKDRKYMFFWKEEGRGDWEAGQMKRQLRSALTAIAKRKLPIEDNVKFSKQLTPEQDTQLRSDVAEIKKEASEGEALAKRFGKDFVKGAKQTRLENKVLQEIKPIVDRVVTNRTKALYDPIADDAKKNVSRQMFQESMRSDIESMVFDEFTGKQDLEKFIVNRAFLRANNLAERLGIKGVEEGITKGLEAAEKVAVEETTAPKADRPKYRNILKSNVLPTETVNTIKDKVLRTVRTLKSKLDTKVSKNKTVTPLIAEIKKNMGKQADIEFKKAMGGKKDAQLRRFLIKNKKVVLENMTTTWLMGAMPGAVQKQVNGSFTSDWQGKKIDREKTSTQQAGRTSGAEIVRRLPNAFKNLDDKTYLSYIIDESGAPIRGRKESLAKAMAEELSFDIFTTELQNEDSNIRKALEGNQKALGVVLADNYVQEVTRDAERGTVKLSKGALPYVGKLVKLGIKNGIDEVVDVDGNILVNLPGMDNIDTKGLGSVVRKAFDIGLVPDGKELRFLQSIQGSKIIPQSIKDSVKRAITSKSELTIRKALAEDMVIVANSLGSDVTNIIGFDGLGFFNRLLDSAKTKKDKITGEIIPGAKGDFYDTKVDMIKNQPKSSGLPINYNGAEVSPMNSKTGVMGKISRILNKDITAEQKMKEYEKLIPEIEAANVQNKILAKYIITKLVNLVQDGKISPKSFISILQAQTNATAGLRSLTGLKYITFKDGPQGNMKGEHLADNGTSMFEIAELGFENNTKKELSFKIDGILEFHDQWLENRETLDFVDQFGKNNPNKDLRIRLLANKDQVFVYTYDLKPAEDLITERESAIKSRNALEKSIDFKQLNTVDTQQKAIDNGTSLKFSNSPKKIRVFDFDDTLARTKSNVLYTMPGEVRIFHGGNIKSVKDIAGFVYFSEDQKQASAYAKGNQGDVSSFKIDETSIATEDQVFDVINALGIKPRAGYEVDESNLYELIDPRFEQSFSKKDLEKLAVALKGKGIKAARFTDTNISQGKNEGRETENIVVFDKKAVQEQSKLTAAEFAAKSDEMAAKGADFDFIEFSKVMNGKEGPLLEVAKIIAEKRGAEDLFVLTARPQDAAGPIQEFLAELGLDIPLENITGLADGNPKAKADWMIGKVAEGYNDFYFADDAIKNVKAVKDVFDTFDIKGKVQQAKVKFSKGLDKGFNDMIERQTGTESFKEFSKGVAQRRGKKVGKFKIFVSPSAEDFRGLTQYKFAGKGKQGEADQKFFEEALMDPYFKGVAAVEAARETIKNDTKALFKIFKPVKKKLNKLVPGIDFTYDGAVRVYLWNKAGIEIPGLTKRDNKKLNDAIANDPELSAFADALLLVSKQDTWPAPTEYWEAKTTLSDLNTLTEKTNRKEYLTEFIENVDIIFSEKNLNKVEALYGKASRVAIENAIFAMKTGSNSPNQSGDGITNSWLKWVNNSIGTIMFFNRRSALLQLTSATNFLNWSDNNPAKAALAFANQPQYWKDWAMIFNSDKLKQRRSGLKSDVQESEIANAAKNTEDKIGSIIAYLLKIGFSPTQIADSIAISSGGATFYRNRVNTYKKQGLDIKEAETKAFEDMSKLSDEAQQSGDPALVSQQQRSVAGRLILSFQNTTMQYTRLMKKAGQDLINKRGDAKTHVSKILYYGALQNFIFNALSQTAFALIPGFDEDEDEDEAKRDEKLEEKASRVLNGMTDSIIRGTGIYGAVVTTLKNTFKTWEREADKGFKGDQAKTILEAANISPAIGSKLRKIYSAIQAYQFDKAIMEKHPWSVTIDGKFNPSATYSVIGNVASATLNLPLDRALAEARGVAEMFDNRNSEMQRIALALGWRTWNVGAKNEEFDLIKMEAKAKKKEEGKIKAKETRTKNRKIKKLENERRDKTFNTLNSAQRKEIFQMNTTDRRAYLDKIAKQKGIK